MAISECTCASDAGEYLDNFASEVAFIVFEHKNAKK